MQDGERESQYLELRTSVSNDDADVYVVDDDDDDDDARSTTTPNGDGELEYEVTESTSRDDGDYFDADDDIFATTAQVIDNRMAISVKAHTCTSVMYLCM